MPTSSGAPQIGSPKLYCPCELSVVFHRGQWQFSFAQKMSFIDLLIPGVSKLFLKLPREILVNRKVLSSVKLLGGHWLHQQTGIQSLTSSPHCSHRAVNSSFWTTAIYLVRFTNVLAEFPSHLTVLHSLSLNQKMAVKCGQWQIPCSSSLGDGVALFMSCLTPASHFEAHLFFSWAHT